ncbi:MAG: hypothetical protein ABEH65_10000 [Halobacteriales archaeon]
MTNWACAIAGCGKRFESPADLIRHQVAAHGQKECQICGDPVHEGYLAIRHVFDEHTRAEYVRAYDADSDEIRHRENVKESIEAVVDVDELLREFETDTSRQPVTADD